MNVRPPDSVAPVTPIEALLLSILAAINANTAAVNGLRVWHTHMPHVALSRADRALLARLLPAIGGVFGSDEFAARELFEKNSAALRIVLRGLNAKRIGRLFQRAEGQVIDGYLVERAGDELHAALWRVVQVPGSGLPAVPPQHSGDLP